MTRAFVVNRYVVESFEVEIESDCRPTREQILNAANDPFAVRTLRETIRPVKTTEPEVKA